MRLDANIRICGEAGQGVQTTGGLLIGALAAAGLHVFGTQSYMSRIRGGANSFDIRISDAELFSGRESAEVLVALTAEALEHFRAGAGAGAVLVFDGDAAGDGILSLPLSAAAKEAGGSAQMVNTVAAGAVLELLGYDAAPLRAVLAEEFKKKGDEVVARNLACIERGARLVAGRRASVRAPRPGQPSGTVLSGSETVGLGAAAAGVKLVASYPMTPSTGVFTWLAGAADEYGIVVEQAEDEIAAINMVIGAVYAGVPAMTTTSGGGFSLMCEGLSLAGMLELPAVVMDSQRPGPATGLPTRTGQEDLKMVVHAGHGEFPRAVYAPGSPEEGYRLIRQALATAHRFQTPVILLLDQFLADQQKNIAPPPAEPDPIDRCIEPRPAADYRRYAVTESGISPLTYPGLGKAEVHVDSDEHDEEGHITEDPGVRVAMVEKRMKKLASLKSDALKPTLFGPADAGTFLICWGSNKLIVKEARERLAAKGKSVAALHFRQVYPLTMEMISGCGLEGKRLIGVENNATGQFSQLLRRELGLTVPERILKYDGTCFTVEEVCREAEKIMEGRG